MPMKLEAWPGGRWYRDLGDDNGHFWGHVQAIKRPTLLEITGPLFMSYPVVSNLQYRLSEEERRNADQVPPQGAWTDSGRTPAGREPGMDAQSMQRIEAKARAAKRIGRRMLCVQLCMASAGVDGGQRDVDRRADGAGR